MANLHELVELWPNDAALTNYTATGPAQAAAPDVDAGELVMYGSGGADHAMLRRNGAHVMIEGQWVVMSMPPVGAPAIGLVGVVDANGRGVGFRSHTNGSRAAFGYFNGQPNGEFGSGWNPAHRWARFRYRNGGDGMVMDAATAPDVDGSPGAWGAHATVTVSSLGGFDPAQTTYVFGVNAWSTSGPLRFGPVNPDYISVPPGTLTTSAASVLRSVVQGATMADPRTVTITAPGGAALALGAPTFPDGQPAWLTGATLDSATTPATLTVSYNPAGLTPAVREARVRVPTTTAGAVPSFVDVLARLEVTAAATPALSVRDAQNNAVGALSFVRGDGARTLGIRNAGTGALTGLSVAVLGATDADPAPAWLTATLAGPDAPADLTIAVNWASGGPGGAPLPPALYAGRVRVSSTAGGVTNSPLTIPVSALAAGRTVLYTATVRGAPEPGYPLGRPLAGRAVRFAVPSRDRARPRGLARNTVDAVTDAQGVATAVFEAQRVAGAVRVTASCEGQTAEATLTVL